MASSLRNQILRLHTFSKYITRRRLSLSSTQLSTPEPQPTEKPLTIPQPDGEAKVYSPKLEQIFQSISQLNLLEVAELSTLLKTRLNLPDAPVMSFGAVAPAPKAVEEEEQEEQKVVQTNFTVKLVKFDEKQKIALIKELKNIIPDMNLVQAKKVIESTPVALKVDVSKAEAESLKEVLTKLGAEIVIE